MRAAARLFLRRHAELLGALALAAGALGLLGRPALAGAPLALGLLLPVLLLAALLGRDGLIRARLGRSGGAGVVAVREGRILYMGPEGGGVVDLDGLVRVDLERKGAGLVWHLTASDGTVLSIPAGAEGAAALPDALAVLPGFDLATSSRATGAAPGARVMLFRRQGIDMPCTPAPTSALSERRW